jgi:hypothetical protein
MEITNKLKTFQQVGTKKCEEQTKEFSPLMLAVSTNQPKIVQLLLDAGADDKFRGCCLGSAKTWMCGSALGLAKMSESHPDIIKMLESRVQRTTSSNSNDRNVLRILNDDNNKTIIEVGTPDLKIGKFEPESQDQFAIESERVRQLKSDPNYMTQQEIEKEKKELEDRAAILEARIRVSKEIEAQIRSVREEEFAEASELTKALIRLTHSEDC